MKKVRLFTEIEIDLEVRDMDALNPRNDMAQARMAQAIQNEIGHTGAVVTTPFSVSVWEIPNE